MVGVLQITEVRKHWKDDPQAEGGFVDLFKYDSKIDTLLPTDDLKNGEFSKKQCFRYFCSYFNRNNIFDFAFTSTRTIFINKY